MGQPQEQQQQQQTPAVEQEIQPQQQQQAPAVEPEITPAPPAYSPRATDEPPHDASQPAARDGPAPVQQIPANLDKSLPQPTMTATQPQQQAVPGVTPFHQLGDQPQWVDCPFCRTRALTRVQKEGSPMQVVAGVLCCLLCVCLACVPCMAGWFETTTFFCSRCNAKLAMRTDSGSLEVYGPTVPSKFA